MTTIGVVTLCSGRRRQLANLATGLHRQARAPDAFVVARMDDDRVDVDASAIVHVPPDPDGHLRLAAARNAAARAAATDIVVFLDVDCIPGAGLVAAYGEAASAHSGLVAGVVRYLPDGVPSDGSWSEHELARASTQHPARPAPPPGEVQRHDLHHLAWTTSLAVRSEMFHALGGFDERFTGYGAEDTDFSERARRAAWPVWWAGGAVAYHQYHGPPGPPLAHVDDIVRNARLFHSLHGWWPMEAWLREFDRRGLLAFRPDRAGGDGVRLEP